MIPLMVVRVVMLAASVTLLVGVWLWCAADEAAEKTERVRASSQPQSRPHPRERLSLVLSAPANAHGGGRHRAPEAGRQWAFTPVWPSRDPDVAVPGSWNLPGTVREPTGRHALAA